MKKIFTLVLAAACFTASAQVEYPYPWNPDADLDGWVSAGDLLELLAVFGGEFAPDSWETDSLSAAVVLDGNHSYFKCQNLCNSIEGRWRMADLDAFGRHFSLVEDIDANFWVESNDKLNPNDLESNVLSLYGLTGNVYVNGAYELSEAKRCLCHIQSSPFVPSQIEEQFDDSNSTLTLNGDTLIIDVSQVSSDHFNYTNPFTVEVIAPFIKFTGEAATNEVYFSLSTPTEVSIKELTILNLASPVARGFLGPYYLSSGQWCRLQFLDGEWLQPWRP